MTVWQAPTPGQATLSGHVNQFLVGHSSTIGYTGSTVGTDPVTYSGTTDSVGSGALGFYFTSPSTATTLSYVAFALGAIGSGADVLVSIQTGTTTGPNGTILSSSVVPAEWLPLGAQTTPGNFCAPLNYAMLASTLYWIVIQPASTLYGATPGALVSSSNSVYTQAAAGYNDVNLARVTNVASTGWGIYSASTGTWTTGTTYGYAVYLRGGTTSTNGQVSGNLRWITDDPITVGTLSIPSKITCYSSAAPTTAAYEWVNRNYGSTQNILCRDDSSFEGGSGSWVAGSNTTVAQSTAHALDGTHSLALTATAAGSMAASTGVGTYPASYYPVVAGQTYTASAYFYPGSTARNVSVYIQWYTSSSSSTTTTGTSVSEVLNTWTQVTSVLASVSAVAPAGALYARVGVNISSAGLSEIHYIDQVGFNIGSSSIWSYPGTGVASKRALTYTSGLLTSIT
jgi:hypothetical protein